VLNATEHAPIHYAQAGPLTGLSEISPAALADIPAEPVGICRTVPGLVIHPLGTDGLGLAVERFDENQIRPASGIVRALLALDPAPLNVPREPGRRVVGTCRHFAVLSCALLRFRGIAARARCGFGTYFQPGQGQDHWITEYWHQENARWVRVDTQHLEGTFVAHPEDLQPGEFLSGGEAWAAYREGQIDARQFGVFGTDNWGPAEIRGNAIRDLAALNKTEMLPWDEWGRMVASYQGETGPDYDELIDEIAAICAADDASAIAACYAQAELQVPPDVIG
jgi:hypothetical protein